MRQMGRQKYLTLLKYVDSTVVEVDFNTGVYHVVYLSNHDFDGLKSGGSFKEAFYHFVETAVHPGDRDMARALMGTYMKDFMKEGFNKRSRNYRVYNQVEQVYRWCRATMLRINTGNPYQKKALIIWEELEMEEDAVPASSTMQLRMFNDAFLSHMIGCVLACLNDREFTIVETNGGMKKLLGYSDEEMKTQFDSKYLNMIYPADRSRILEETGRQLKSGNSVELEYRLTAKDGRIIWVLERCQSVTGKDSMEYLVFALMDITVSKKDQEELRLSLERHKIIMEQAEDTLFEWDTQTDTVTYSANFEKKFGYTPIMKNFSKRIRFVSHIHPADIPEFTNMQQLLMKGMLYREIEFRLSDAAGRYRWCRLRASSQFDAAGKVSRVIGMLADVDEQKRAEEALQYQADRDELTQLYNRRTARRLIEAILEEPCVQGYRALMVLDVDDFKKINDSNGHMFGDSVLRAVADILTRQFRSEDILARIGGDEFLLFMSHVPDVKTVETRMSMVLESIQDMCLEQGMVIHPSCSIGAAFQPLHGNDFDTLFRHADTAMYGAKGKGKSCFRIYDASLRMPSDLGIEA